MIPKNHKIFKEGIANEAEVHENVVDDFISFYYSNVRQALSSLEHNKIFVDGLGTFTLRKARIEKSIVKNKSYLGNLEKNTYKGYGKHIPVKEKIETLEKALEVLKEELTDKKKFKDENN